MIQILRLIILFSIGLFVGLYINKCSNSNLSVYTKDIDSILLAIDSKYRYIDTIKKINVEREEVHKNLKIKAVNYMDRDTSFLNKDTLKMYLAKVIIESTVINSSKDSIIKIQDSIIKDQREIIDTLSIRNLKLSEQVLYNKNKKEKDAKKNRAVNIIIAAVCIFSTAILTK